MSHPFKIVTYVAVDPEAKPRAVAHCFEHDPKTGKLTMLPATRTGADPQVCAFTLSAFLDDEVARRSKPRAKANADA